MKAGAILAGIAAFAEYLIHPDTPSDGAVQKIVFGDLALLWGFLAMGEVFVETPKARVISVIAMGLGLVAALLSETRNTWVAAPILTLGLMFIWWRGGHLSTRRVVATLAVAVIAIVVCASTPVFQKRYIEMTTELRSLDDYSGFHSVKDRVVMWKAAWKTSGESLILGHGLHNANTAILPHVHPPPTIGIAFLNSPIYIVNISMHWWARDCLASPRCCSCYSGRLPCFGNTSRPARITPWPAWESSPAAALSSSD